MTYTFFTFLLPVVFILHLLYRNEKTFSYLGGLAKRIHKSTLRDIDEGKTPEWDYDNMPPYSYVLFSMKPIRDESFLSPEFIEWLNG